MDRLLLISDNKRQSICFFSLLSFDQNLIYNQNQNYYQTKASDHKGTLTHDPRQIFRRLSSQTSLKRNDPCFDVTGRFTADQKRTNPSSNKIPHMNMVHDA